MRNKEKRKDLYTNIVQVEPDEEKVLNQFVKGMDHQGIADFTDMSVPKVDEILKGLKRKTRMNSILLAVWWTKGKASHIGSLKEG